MEENLNNAVQNPEQQNTQTQVTNAPTTSPTNDGGQDSTAQPQPTWQELAGVDPNEFDSPEKLAKSYKDARTGLSKMGENIKELETFRDNAVPILQAIKNDPKLLAELEKRLGGTYEESDNRGNQPDPIAPVSNQVNELSTLEKARTVANFEATVGISDMDESQAKEVRAEVGKIMQRWIPAGVEPSPAQLPQLLSDAWAIYERDHGLIPKKEARPSVFGFGTPRTITNSPAKQSASEILTADQKKAAERFGMSYEEYLANM